MQTKTSIEPAVVQDFVRKGHSDLEGVKDLLRQELGLINAAWDWGGGDWETALGGASHCGQLEIALYLLGCGARMDIFAAAMLGELDIVKAIIAADPAAATAPGPHGIPLIVHAQQGGEQADAVLKYLQSLRRFD